MSDPQMPATTGAARIVTGKERAIKLAREIIRNGGASTEIVNLARQYLRELTLPE